MCMIRKLAGEPQTVMMTPRKEQGSGSDCGVMQTVIIDFQIAASSWV